MLVRQLGFNMKLTVELTYYPFQNDHIPPIKGTIDHLNTFDDIQVQTFPTATIIVGDYGVVMDMIRDTVAWSYQQFGRSVFVAKFIPAHDVLGGS